MLMHRFIYVATLSMLCASAAYATELADRVIVVKSERKLYLMSSGKVLKEMPISLGLRPKGGKQKEGDFRTPEGEYVLDRRNNESRYFLSIQVSYPNTVDRLQAEKTGVRPGSHIMIHGHPNEPKHSRQYYSNVDWTDGCIAVSNADMVNVWRLTTLDTPISIIP